MKETHRKKRCVFYVKGGKLMKKSRFLVVLLLPLLSAKIQLFLAILELLGLILYNKIHLITHL